MSKNVVIVGKGPSTRFIPKSDDYKIACLNNAIINCEEVDYFFCHDQDNIDLIEDEWWSKVKTAIVPEYPQQAYPGGFEESYKFNVWTDEIKKHNPLVNFFLVRLGVHDMNNLPRLQDGEECPHMGETYSVLQTAATWLGMFDRVDNLITCGLDPSGGYHPMFQTMKMDEETSKIIPTTNGNKVWNPKAAQTTHDKLHKIARHYGYSILRLEEDGTQTKVV
jgi:Zn-finger protein